jgi:hypothetical protein
MNPIAVLRARPAARHARAAGPGRAAEPAPIEAGLPSPGRMAAGLAGAAMQVLAAAAKGGPVTVPEAVREARLATCRACPFYRASDGRCGGAAGCGCFTPIKSHLAALGCPRGYWAPWRAGT